METTLAQLLSGETSYDIGWGNIEFKNVKIVERPSFFDFLRSGWELSLKVAIDFTKSNGDVNDYRSLHYIDRMGNKSNDYEQAIIQVGSILDFYSAD